MSTPPQENKKQLRLVVTQQPFRQLSDQQPDTRSSSGVLAQPQPPAPRFHCPFVACGKGCSAFAGWQRAEQLLQHINSIHASRSQWPSDAFLQQFDFIVCKECKLVASSRTGCPSCRGRRIQQAQGMVNAEEDIPDVDYNLQLTSAQVDSLWNWCVRGARVHRGQASTGDV